MSTKKFPSSKPLVDEGRTMRMPARFELLDGDRIVGWIDATAIGFRGFATHNEAAHAAWVAYRTMERRLNRGTGMGFSNETRPMSLVRSGDAELIVAGGSPIATLVRPGAESRSGSESFGFELPLPMPADEVTRRSTAYLIHRELRRLGVLRATTEPATLASATAGDVSEIGRSPEVGVAPVTSPTGGADARVAADRRGADSDTLATVLVLLGITAAIILPAITTSIMFYAIAVAVLIAFASFARPRAALAHYRSES